MSIQFNGTTDRIDVSYTVASYTPVSMSIWFKPDILTSNMALMSIGVAASPSNFHTLRVDTSASTLRVHAQSWDGSTPLGDAQASTTLGSSLWSHAGGVWTSNISRAAYFNGGNKGTDTADSTFTATPDQVSLGVTADSTPTVFYDGALAHAALWEAALSDSEMAILGAGVSPLLVRPSSLVFYMPLVRDNVELMGAGTPSATGTSVTDHFNVILPPNVTPLRAGTLVAPKVSHLLRLANA